MKTRNILWKSLLLGLLIGPTSAFGGNYLNVVGAQLTTGELPVAIDSSGSGQMIATPVTIDPTTGNISGAGSFTPSSISVSGSASGANKTIAVANTSNTAGSNAVFVATVGGTSGGDPMMQWVIPGGTTWSVGPDNSASDALTFAASNTLGNSNMFTVTTSGAMSTAAGISASSGSITAPAGTVTGGTGLVATTGNVTASAAGAGLVLVPVTGTAAAGATATCNGRLCIVTFTSVSIAAGATQVLTVSDSSIASSSTAVMYSMSGATASSALSAVSAVPGTSQWVLTLTNGTGAATSTANIVLVILVLS